jgi:steroid delta-isomerase
MTNQERFLTYLRLYAAKDIAQISGMFAEDITLRDWKIRVQGKAAAVAETKTNFAAANSIEIQPLRLYEAAGAVVGELRIVVDGNTELFVVDALDFDARGKITAIRAFLGRGDA